MMVAAAVRIERLRARYRVAGDSTARGRLDRALAAVLDTCLEEAIDRLHFSRHDCVCIRRLNVPFQVRLSAPDLSIARDWGAAIVDEIARLDRQGSTDLVRYASRSEVLLDVVRSVADGDRSRRWAWGPLLSWPVQETGADGELRQAVVASLLASPQLVVCVLAELARDPYAFQRFVDLVDKKDWYRLVRGVLTAYDVSPEIADRPEAWKRTRRGQIETARGGFPDERYAEVAERIVPRSVIAEAVRRAEGHRGWALATLIVLEVEPTALWGGVTESAGLVGRVLQIVSGVRKARPRTSSSGERETRVARHRRDPNELVEGKTLDAPRSRAPSDRVPLSAEQRGLLRSAHPSPETEAPVEYPIIRVRQSATTQYGGLLYAVHIINEISLPTAIRKKGHFDGRTFRWVLHQLALALVPVADGDPAALALAGLRPDDSPPTTREGPATGKERRRIDRWATRILRQFRVRIGLDDEESVVETIFRRDAEVVADPGWIEIHFRQEDVSTDVRRAGLDSDPGFVRWLGVVLRFVYE